MDALYVSPGHAPSPAPLPPGADTLAILLPGAYGTPEDFLREGFAAAVAERHLPLDLALADAPVSLYSDGAVFGQLRDDLMHPARQRGYRHIWLVGISLGGLASLAYAARHENAAEAAPDGVLALAPYLGNRAITGAIAAVGGVAGWTPPALGEDDVEFQVWAWLKGYGNPGGHRAALPLHLGYGRDDRFSAGHRLMADALPAGRVLAVAGGHDWPTWRTLWQGLLDRDALGLATRPALGATA